MTTLSPGKLSIDLVAKSDLFRGLQPRALSEIARHAAVLEFARGRRIFSQGQKAEHAHLLLRGRVKIVQSGAGGEQLMARLIRPGETFGTAAFYIGGLYPADAVAADSVAEARWPRRAFEALVRKHPEIALNLVHIVGARLQESQLRLREMSSERVEQRVASALLRVAPGEGGEHGGARLPLSRRDVAELAGTTLYTASRILSDWQRKGIVQGGRAAITVLQPASLSKIASR